MSANEYLQLLRLLTGAGVDFVVVGGTAAVLHGASTATYDLDVLMPFTPDNCARLLQALSGIHPRGRFQTRELAERVFAKLVHLRPDSTSDGNALALKRMALALEDAAWMPAAGGCSAIRCGDAATLEGRPAVPRQVEAAGHRILPPEGTLGRSARRGQLNLAVTAPGECFPLPLGLAGSREAHKGGLRHRRLSGEHPCAVVLGKAARQAGGEGVV